MADKIYFKRDKNSFLNVTKGGILANVLILLFFVAAVGIPFVLFVFAGDDADNKSDISSLDDKTKPRKLSKLESEASRKKEQADHDDSSNVEDTEDTSINENLKLAGLWKKHYQSIETTAKDLENSSLLIDDDLKYAEILSQYKKIQMLNTIYSDEKLGKYITQDIRDNLKEYVKSIGDYLSEYKKSYVLSKADAFVASHAYDEALSYLKDVVEGKYHYDMPQIFIDNKCSGVAGISRKDREIEKYWFEKENFINAEKEFRTNQI
ncbi:MAG: hypothetical protein KAR20_29280, partial [Candidatus Heimdallarchaeota archaeon]|nr:hypothetical protein [Candidatus Heimdallarchaeota archaeon]